MNSDAANVRTKNPTQKLVSEQITRKNDKMASGDMEKSFRHYHSTNQSICTVYRKILLLSQNCQIVNCQNDSVFFFSCDGYLF